MKSLILAAGYGTRLYPLTIDQPKVLLKIAGKCILERIIRKIESVGDCSDLYIVSNARFYEGIKNWCSGQKFDFPVDIINDHTTSNDDRLGAIGDIELFLKLKNPDSDLLIIAGDNLFEFDLADFVSFSRKKDRLCVALFDVKDLSSAVRYGIVSVDEKQKVVRFQEKPPKPESTLASTGIYYLPRHVLGAFAEYMATGRSKDAPGNFVQWMSETHEVYGYTFTQGWYDIGDLAMLKKADEEYTRKGL